MSDLDTFLDYCSSLKFSRQCFQWEDGESLQAANLGDGNDLGESQERDVQQGSSK